jgi:hypothetical protein
MNIMRGLGGKTKTGEVIKGLRLKNTKNASVQRKYESGTGGNLIYEARSIRAWTTVLQKFGDEPSWLREAKTAVSETEISA